MMKKQIGSLVLAGALLLGTAAPLVASADGTTGKTDSTVQFEAPVDVTDPVDPTDPSKPDPGDTGGVTDPSGNLTFLYVSPTIDFGRHKTVTTGKQTISNEEKAGSVSVTSRAFGDTETPANTNFVTEVSDTRGTNAGWKIQVTSSKITDNPDDPNAGNLLDGAYVNLLAAGTTGNTINNSADNTGISGADVNLPTDGTSAKTIYTATAGNGAGQTAFQLSPDNITMTNIPANVVSGTYSGTLTWTLTDSATD